MRTDFYFVSRQATQRDTNLTIEARALHAWVLGRPDDWLIWHSSIQTATGWGKKKVSRIVAELVSYGLWVERGPVRRGVCRYWVRESLSLPVPCEKGPRIVRHRGPRGGLDYPRGDWGVRVRRSVWEQSLPFDRVWAHQALLGLPEKARASVSIKSASWLLGGRESLTRAILHDLTEEGLLEQAQEKDLQGRWRWLSSVYEHDSAERVRRHPVVHLGGQIPHVVNRPLTEIYNYRENEEREIPKGISLAPEARKETPVKEIYDHEAHRAKVLAKSQKKANRKAKESWNTPRSSTSPDLALHWSREARRLGVSVPPTSGREPSLFKKWLDAGASVRGLEKAATLFLTRISSGRMDDDPYIGKQIKSARESGDPFLVFAHNLQRAGALWEVAVRPQKGLREAVGEALVWEPQEDLEAVSEAPVALPEDEAARLLEAEKARAEARREERMRPAREWREKIRQAGEKERARLAEKTEEDEDDGFEEPEDSGWDDGEVLSREEVEEERRREVERAKEESRESLRRLRH